jgi:hypothetical protein
MLIILKAAGAITKEFLNASSSHMNGILKAVGVGISPLYSFQWLSETCSHSDNQLLETLLCGD